ncbi:TlpA family protein disulfide reductase [Amphibacillus sp. MSJ-3]|uniref:peroxiredoxin family protein n=1 Tax=Amphibacillus sp. MSJ-3 TaxID=2841505 RepID=UPI001C0E98D0|nr:TlpA disulfide reductase family protein [Amphibacillus sp. MSJ-3]MBU5594127.1 TlpA family protein disulfide reductase [Amphibacillus sp. MSJ-3]
MKKVVLSLILLGMFSWTIYDFFTSTSDESKHQSLEEDTEKAEIKEGREEDGRVEDAGENTIGLEIGQLAPDFVLTTLSGDEVSLSDYRGQPLMLNFWATWCPPCRAEMPDMEKFYQNTDVEILAINLTDTEADINEVQEFVDKYDLTFPILLDEAIEVAMIYAIQPIPTSFMIDSEGIIRFKTSGPLTYEQMMQVLEEID